MSRNPTKQAEKYNFILINFKNNNKRHIGICECGITGTVSYDSLRKGKFCRNNRCRYYQSSKRLDESEMKIIILEKKCVLISLLKKGKDGILRFICNCGFEQESSWLLFYRDHFFKYYKCEKYHRQKEITTELYLNFFLWV